MNVRGEASIEDEVRQVVSGHLGLPSSSLRLDDRIMEDLGADSLDSLELIMTVEEVFGVRIGFERAEEIKTLADLVATIERQPAEFGRARASVNSVTPGGPEA